MNKGRGMVLAIAVVLVCLAWAAVLALNLVPELRGDFGWQIILRVVQAGLWFHPLIWLVVTVLDVIAIVSILKSSVDSGTKLLWCVLVILLPVLGMILYFLMGPGRKAAV